MSQTDPNVAQVLTAYVSAKLGEMLKTMVTSEKVSPDLFLQEPRWHHTLRFDTKIWQAFVCVLPRSDYGR